MAALVFVFLYQILFSWTAWYKINKRCFNIIVSHSCYICRFVEILILFILHSAIWKLHTRLTMPVRYTIYIYLEQVMKYKIKTQPVTDNCGSHTTMAWYRWFQYRVDTIPCAVDIMIKGGSNSARGGRQHSTTVNTTCQPTNMHGGLTTSNIRSKIHCFVNVTQRNIATIPTSSVGFCVFFFFKRFQLTMLPVWI